MRLDHLLSKEHWSRQRSRAWSDCECRSAGAQGWNIDYLAPNLVRLASTAPFGRVENKGSLLTHGYEHGSCFDLEVDEQYCPRRARTCSSVLPRKEVIQPHLPVRLPCYDFTPITDPTLDGSLLAVRPPASGVADFRGVTGGVYKAREHIHRGVLTRDY